ncbi:hypothetical protein MNBD_GAMMA18-133 [hydrothermal vent metagenome]|uniref:TIR domain-containing protein n=2 Tax=hydrothermal vent metagenome TaxID=652676 RepID=A0A3B0ZEV5_9ZZZZ
MANEIFISHSTLDDPIVTAIRQKLELADLSVWSDSRKLTAGDQLEATITEAIDEASYLIAILSQHAVNSPWVEKEIDYALAKQKSGQAIKIIPLLIDPIKTGALGTRFGDEPVAIKLEVAAGGIDQSLPDLFAALGLQLPNDPQPPETKEEKPIADLVLELTDPTIDELDGKLRASANAALVYHPVAGEKVQSTRFRFSAPIGAIEADDLRWYLESWATWPSEHFKMRADKVEASLPEWGKQLYAALDQNAARSAIEAWKKVAGDQSLSRRFTVQVDAALIDGSSEAQQAQANEAATQLLALPWELLHNQRSYLFQGADGVRVRRQLPNRDPQPALITDPPIRILMLSPRPEDDRAGYIDHRVSARPVVEALAPLEELVQLDILTPPTFKAMTDTLQQAHESGKPYHVVHFDGHGIYDRQHGLGALCFENEQDKNKLQKRRTDSVDADRIAAALTDHRVPLFFLEACQSAKSENDPTASVAGRLLQGGVASVVAMSHSVLVETARRFVGAFYRALMAGEPVGLAMLAGQRELHRDAIRFKGFSGDLNELQDWFVPVLFQESADPQLIHAVPAERVQAVTAEQQQRQLGKLPEPPPHHFVGRSRELLTAERLLERQPYVVLRGEGGEGKTTLAVELARWLVASRRFQRVAFVSAEDHDDAKKMRWAIGSQLVAGFKGEDDDALQQIQRQLDDHATLIILDNMETVLQPHPDADDYPLFEPEKLQQIFQLCQQLSQNSHTRLIFTSREPLPEPYQQHPVTIGRLTTSEAIELVGQVLQGVLGEGELMPHTDGDAESNEEIEKLVEAVMCHARSLVLLAGEIAQSGVSNATEQLHTLMARLHQRFPDDRERSLLASVELSLRRLPLALRQKLGPLGLFHGGGHLMVIGQVLELDNDEEVALAQQLIQVGLAQAMPYNHLRLNPALTPALRLQMAEQLDETAQQAAQQHWSEVMGQFTHFLYQQQFKDAQLAATLTLLELPNLLANLRWLEQQQPQQQFSAEHLVGLATRVEGLLQNLNRPRALAQVVSVREKATQRLGEWGSARFQAEDAAVDRLLQAGHLPEALTAAQTLLQKAQSAGEQAYAGAGYDLAMASFSLGRVLRMSGNATAALRAIESARKGFQRLAEGGNSSAAGMAAKSLSEQGNCLRDLGRLEEAADAYEESIELAEGLKDPRQVAADKTQLGSVRLLQKNYAAALSAYEAARDIFTELNEPATLATAWHQTGRVYQEMKQFEAADNAYRESLRIKVQRDDRAGQASSLGQLGNLYSAMGRREEAVKLLRQAADIYVALKDLANEGAARSNIAHFFIQLNRPDDARTELQRAIECKAPYGHAAEPWKTFNILTDLERTEGNHRAAAEARQQAITAFLAYRRDGGENLSGSQTPQLTALVSQAIQSGETEAIGKQRQQLTERQQHPELPDYLKALIPALQQILNGNRDAALADDPALDYDDAAELTLLLEQL